MLAAFLGLLCLFPQGEQDAPAGLRVVIVDVGQGDGAVIQAPDGTVHVVDAGYDGQGSAAVLPAITALQPTGYGFTFLTHFHDDHQGGLDEVLAAWPFQLAFDRGDVRRTNTSTATRNYLAAASGRRRQVIVGTTYPLGGGATLRVIAANGVVAGGTTVNVTSSSQEENSRSIALRLDYGDFSMWLGGDLTGGGNSTADVESPAALSCGDVDVYHVNHHGSNTSTNANLLSRTSPELAVVSAGVNNPYGHPTISTVNRIVQAATWRTLLSTTAGTGTIGFGVCGDITISTDGRRYRVAAENGDFLDLYVDEVVGPAPGVGDVAIAEVHPNPSRVPDTGGEYVEVVNVGGRPLALRGLRLADNSSLLTLATNYMLVPGRPLVFNRDGDPSRNGGLPLGPTVPFGTMALGNSGDTVALTMGGTTVDQVSYGSSYPYASGIAAERRDLAAFPSAGNFAAAVAPYGLGDRGSPGRRNDADSTVHPVLVDIEARAGELVLRGTAIGRGGFLSVMGVSFGTAPGFPFVNVHVPLNRDPLLALFLAFPGILQPMPAGGYRSLAVPMPQPNPLSGVPIHAAHLVLDLSTTTAAVSTAATVIVP